MADRDTEEIVRQRDEPIAPAGGVDEGEEPSGQPPVASGVLTETIASPPSPIRRVQFHASWLLIAIWAVLIALLVAFFAFGSVTIYPRGGLDRKMRIDHIWALFRDDLPTVGHQAVLSAFFYGSIALMVIGMAWALFLALGTRTVDGPGEREPAQSIDTVSPRF